MAITQTWGVHSLYTADTVTLSGAVVQVNWHVTCSDPIIGTGVIKGFSVFPLSAIDPSGFINYNDLTEETVLKWVNDELASSTDTTYHKLAVYAPGMSGINHVTDGNLPWNTL